MLKTLFAAALSFLCLLGPALPQTPPTVRMCIMTAGVCVPVSATAPLPVGGVNGSVTFTTSQVTVTTASTAVCPVRAGRRSCTITAITGSQQLFCSGTTATAANGQLIPAVVAASFTAATAAAINCIAVTSSQIVSVAEVY